MEKFTATLYICGCGYKTLHQGNASKHKKKISCGHVMTSTPERFVLESDHLKTVVESRSAAVQFDDVIKEQNDVIKRQGRSISLLSDTNVSDDNDDDYEIGGGIIYYVTDKDVPSRGKIGRTKNTDMKKLKSRYSTFSKPSLFCFFSTDIKKDENDLKAVLKEHGCMDTSIGKETVHHCAETMRIFHEFINR